MTYLTNCLDLISKGLVKKYPIPSLTLLFIVIFLILLSIFANYMRKKKHHIKNDHIIDVIHSYHVTCISCEIFDVLFILCVTIGVLFYFRVSYIYYYYDLNSFLINDSNVTFSYFLFILFFFLSIFIYFRLMNEYLVDVYYRIHVYLYQYKFYDWFIESMYNRYIRFPFTFIDKVEARLLLWTSIRYLNKDHSDEERRIVDYISTHPMLKRLLTLIIIPFFGKVSIILRTIYYYYPYIIVFIMLLNDLYNEKIEKIYVGLLFFFIINVYRRYRKFIGQCDLYGIDKKMTNYFYKTNQYASVIYDKDLTTRLMQFMTVSELNTYLWNNEEHILRNYFNDNYLVWYIPSKERNLHFAPYNHRYLLLGLVYMPIYYNNPTESILIVSYFVIMLIPLLIIEYIYYRKEKRRDLSKTKKIILYIIYYIMIKIGIIINIWLYLTRHVVKYTRDIIWDKVIILKHMFTIDEKVSFMRKYAEYKVEQYKYLKLEERLDLYSKIWYDSIIPETTIAQIKEYIDNLVYMELELDYGLHSDLEIMSTSTTPLEYFVFILTLWSMGYFKRQFINPEIAKLLGFNLLPSFIQFLKHL